MTTGEMATTFAAVKAARGQAYREAKSDYPWVRSRGTFLCTADRGGQCDPNPEAACPEWNGTKREVEALIALDLDRL